MTTIMSYLTWQQSSSHYYENKNVWLTWQQLSPIYYDNHNVQFNMTAIKSLLLVWQW